MKWWWIAVALVGCDSAEAEPQAAPALPRSATELEDCCRNDDADACDVLGAMYQVGKDVAEDCKRALELRRKALGLFDHACRNGDAEACKRVLEAPAAKPAPSAAVPAPSAASLVDPWKEGVLEIAVHPDTISVDKQRLEPAEVSARLARACAASPKPRVHIDAAAGTNHGRVIELLDELKRAGCDKVAIGVPPSLE